MVRFWQDIRGEDKRKRRALRIAPCTGPNHITISEAKRKGAEIIMELGIDTPQYFERVVSPIQTFAEKAKWVRANDPAFLEGRPGSVQSMNTAMDKHILPLLGSLPLQEVNEARVQEFITYLKTTMFERRAKDGHLIKTYRLSYSTIKSIIKTVKRVLGKKVWIDWELKLGKAPDRVPQRTFTDQQMLDIIAIADGMWKVFFSMLAGTGIRIGECCGLEVTDLDLENQVVYIQRQFSQQASKMLPPKSRAGYRAIDIDADLANLLREHVVGRSSGLVFSARNGKPLRGGNVIKRVLNPILQQLGIPLGGKLLHAFRHGRVTLLKKKQTPDDLMLQWIGHTSLDMTGRYTHTDQELEYRRTHAARARLRIQ